MLDRTLQRQLLEDLAAAYPDRVDLNLNGDQDSRRRIANLLYLEEHDLIDAGLEPCLDGSYAHSGSKISAKGLDFLQDDGGLTAILGTVTVKLHEDSIRSLLKEKLDQSSLAPEDKSKFRKQIDSISSEALKSATKKLVDKGIDALPDAASWIQTLFS